MAYSLFFLFLLSAKPLVVTSLPPLLAMARFVGGDEFEYRSLLKGGENPHSYELRPSDLRKVSGSSLFLAVGGGPDAWVTTLIASAPRSLVLIDSLRVKRVEFRDPHIWVDPQALPTCFSLIALAMGNVLPQRVDSFQKRKESALFLLDSLLTLYRELGKEKEIGPVLINHPLWKPLLESLGIEVVATIFQSGTAELSLSRYYRLLKEGKDRGVKLVIGESNFPQKTPMALSREMKARYVALDPLFDGEFFGGLEANLRKIVLQDGSH